VRLPAFIVCALETVANRDRTTLDACLHRELMDLAGLWAEEMEATHPGYRRAYLFFRVGSRLLPMKPKTPKPRRDV
jgi:hypothetical protein